jgi:apolipoprotein D and lipocalin family protein
MEIDITPIPQLDLDRYLGRWYEVARFDHRFERGLSKATAEYTRNADGTIKVVNTAFDARHNRQRKIVGKAKTTTNPGLLKVSFFWIFYSDYRVLAIGDDYDWALVGGGKSTDYLWILARKPHLEADPITAIIAEAKRRGYDTSRLVYPLPAEE